MGSSTTHPVGAQQSPRPPKKIQVKLKKAYFYRLPQGKAGKHVTSGQLLVVRVTLYLLCKAYKSIATAYKNV